MKTRHSKGGGGKRKGLPTVREERLRIARELHDRVLQQISTVKLRAEVCRRELLNKPRELSEALAAIERAADDAVGNIRLILADIQPRSDLIAGTLERRLRDEMKIFQDRAGVRIEFHCAAGRINLPHRVERELYFALREAVINAIRHSRASTLELSLSRTGAVYSAALSDDGVGFDPAMAEEGGHYGLRGMRERIEKIGGELRIDSAPGKGTRITMTIPMRKKSAGNPR